MHQTRLLHGLIVAAALTVLAGQGRADVGQMFRCQKRIAGAGVTFARTALRATLKCTNEITRCQILCEQGLLGPNCDPDDPDSTAAYRDCLDDADVICQQQTIRIGRAEVRKRDRIIAACSPLTVEQLCGTATEGLNFATLNAGCRALDPNYECNLTNLVDCVGGPLEQALLGQISGLLDARASEGIAALGIEGQFPGVPVARKITGQVGAAQVDLLSITGNAGEEVIVTVQTVDDNGNGTSNLQPFATLVAADGVTPIADTTVETIPCAVPNVCGGGCPQFKRTLPFSQTFFIAVQGVVNGACTGGGYRVVVTSTSGLVPTSPSGAFLDLRGGVLD
jgi:hypothetical protein